MDFIERDALANTPESVPIVESHAHEQPMKSLIMPSNYSKSFWQRVKGLFRDSFDPSLTVIKGADGLRYMFLISSNSYQDREFETMTTKALDAYEASCYPGEGLFRCDNPLLWYHDPDVPMGTIIAVNHSPPLLIEVAKELPDNPIASVLWDYAEQQGDQAGASIRFGYKDEDRSAYGDFDWIRKIETSYLPERALAANIRTYAGVLSDMSSPESDKRLDKIFEEVTGGKVKNAADMIHAKSGELKKELAAMGVTHKSANKAAPPVVADDTAAAEADAEADMEAKAEAPGDFAKYLETLNQIYALVMSMVDAQSGMYDAEMGMMKALKALEEERVKVKAYSDTLEKRLEIVEKRLNMSGRSVTQQRDTNAEALTKAAKDLVDGVEKDGTSKVWGFEAAPPIDYTSVTGK